jgi:ribonuclease HII
MPARETSELLNALTDSNDYDGGRHDLPQGFQVWNRRGVSLWTPGGVIGVDEAGRGAWAGPVVVAAVWWPYSKSARAHNRGLNDSKKLTARARAAQVGHIEQDARAFAVVAADHQAVDELNVRAATLQAMSLALDLILLGDRDDQDETAEAGREAQGRLARIVIDGDAVPEAWRGIAQPLVGGDGIEPAVMAASILAKTARDRWMAGEADARFPKFGFAAHKGYGVPVHQEALRALGPTEIHRRTFAPVKACLKNGT